ncbi:MAG: ParA family protein [Sulfuricella sp.]|nr:ParA family protein [Sulfuricella sp.]
MRTILVANPKGGSGKTTLSTNLAGYFANLGKRVMLADLDRQQSSAGWLARRPAVLPTIHGWSGGDSRKAIAELRPHWLIMDSPAGMHGDKLSNALKRAELVVVPVQPSAFDMAATRDFIELLRAEKSVRKEKSYVAMIGMRVDARTRAADDLELFLDSAGFPVLTFLRDTQAYVQAAGDGISLFDLTPGRVVRDMEQWKPLLDWLKE